MHSPSPSPTTQLNLALERTRRPSSICCLNPSTWPPPAGAGDRGEEVLGIDELHISVHYGAARAVRESPSR